MMRPLESLFLGGMFTHTACLMKDLNQPAQRLYQNGKEKEAKFYTEGAISLNSMPQWKAPSVGPTDSEILETNKRHQISGSGPRILYIFGKKI